MKLSLREIEILHTALKLVCRGIFEIGVTPKEYIDLEHKMRKCLEDNRGRLLKWHIKKGW